MFDGAFWTVVALAIFTVGMAVWSEHRRRREHRWSRLLIVTYQDTIKLMTAEARARRDKRGRFTRKAP